MDAKFEDLLGKTITKIDQSSDQLIFTLDSGAQYIQYHSQSCCESVSIEDIVGELDDLLNSPILLAEEVTHEGENPEGVPHKEWQDSFTWTFYKLATMKGRVTIRWYGSSNGYYSERVEFELMEEGHNYY